MMAKAGQRRGVKPLIVSSNSTNDAMRFVLAGASEVPRRLVRFDHPLAPAARGALWLAMQDMSQTPPGAKPKTLHDAFPAAGRMARMDNRTIMCVAPNLHTWSCDDLRDLILGLYVAHQNNLPVCFVGVGAKGIKERLNQRHPFSDALFDHLQFIKSPAYE